MFVSFPGAGGIETVYHTWKKVCICVQVVGVCLNDVFSLEVQSSITEMGFRFVFGGTTLHVIALSYKDKAVIS